MPTTALGLLLSRLRRWWDTVVNRGKDYGYHANAAKTILIVKPSHLEKAKTIFGDTNIQINADGSRHLGGALGTRAFVERYVEEKVQRFCTQLDIISNMAETEPQAAYGAYVYGLKAKWTFLQRTVPGTDHLFAQLEERLRDTFLPKVTGRTTITDPERKILGLPARLGGIGIPNPVDTAEQNYDTSRKVTRELTAAIRNQEQDLSHFDEAQALKDKKKVIQEKREAEQFQAEKIKREIIEAERREGLQARRSRNKPPDLVKAMEMASEKGASSWLTHLPSSRYDFVLPKRDFRDAMAIRYGWKPNDIPPTCACGAQNTIAHATCLWVASLSSDMEKLAISLHSSLRKQAAKLSKLSSSCNMWITNWTETEVPLKVTKHGWT